MPPRYARGPIPPDQRLQVPIGSAVLMALIGLGLLVSLFVADSNSGTAQTGQTLYVAVDGDDNNPGTLELPLGTIQHAVYLATPGDTVYVRGGLYHESLMITVSGTPGNPIRILAYGNEQPILDGEYLLPSGPPATPSIIDNPPIPPEEFVWTPLVKITGSYIEFRGFEIIRSRGRGITISGLVNTYNHDIVVSDCAVRGARNAGILNIYTENVTIERCEITDAGNYAPYSRSPFVLNWPVIVNMRSARHVTLRENRIHHSWGEGVSAGRDSEHITIEDNLIYNNFALQLYIHRSQHVTVTRNFLYHTNEAAYQREGNPSQCIVVNNESNFVNSLTVDQVQIANNVVVGCRRLIASWGHGSNYPIENVTIEHNTLVNAVSNTVPDDAYAFWIGDANLTNMVIRKNVVSQQSFLVATAPANPQLQFSENVWSSAPPAEASGPGDWIGDPQLENPSATLEPGAVEVNWYKPSVSSPLLTPPLSAVPMGPTAYIVNDDVTGCSGWPTGGCPPPAATLISPQGVITETTPTFLWNSVPEATGYTMVLYNVSNNAIEFTGTYTSSICAGGQCAVQPVGLTLSSGERRWLIQTENEDGHGEWSYNGP